MNALTLEQVIAQYLLKARSVALERRAKVALMFFPPCQLEWQYHEGEDTPRLAVRPNQRKT